MSTLDLEIDFDARVTTFELDWWLAFEASLRARQSEATAVGRAHERPRVQELKSQSSTLVEPLEQFPEQGRSC